MPSIDPHSDEFTSPKQICIERDEIKIWKQKYGIDGEKQEIDRESSTNEHPAIGDTVEEWRYGFKGEIISVNSNGRYEIKCKVGSNRTGVERHRIKGQYCDSDCEFCTYKKKEEAEPPYVPVDHPFHCCIVSSFNYGGDCILLGCPYFAFCGKTADYDVAGYYALCGGFNPTCRNGYPCIEVPCIISCPLWPVIYPMGLMLSFLTGGKVVHAGTCCYGESDIAGPTYNSSDWTDEDPACILCRCCGLC